MTKEQIGIRTSGCTKSGSGCFAADVRLRLRLRMFGSVCVRARPRSSLVKTEQMSRGTLRILCIPCGSGEKGWHGRVLSFRHLPKQQLKKVR